MNQFHGISDFLESIDGADKEIVEELRNLVLESIPDVNEKLSYNVPYYYGKRRICFIWPSSIPWGKVKKNGVFFGFCQGNLMQDELGFLEKGERKQVFGKTYSKASEIKPEVLRRYLYEAVRIDGLF